tara:strand:+ start:372 stop:605 length:234 start_codon:yes stop_codon:yes gene_type:complete
MTLLALIVVVKLTVRVAVAMPVAPVGPVGHCVPAGPATPGDPVTGLKEGAGFDIFGAGLPLKCLQFVFGQSTPLKPI